MGRRFEMRTYIQLAQTVAGEIGHNGWMMTLNWSQAQQDARGNFNVPVVHRLDRVTSYIGDERGILLAPFGGAAIDGLDFATVAEIEARGNAHRRACDAALGYDPSKVVVRGTGFGPGEAIDRAEWTWG
jgi:hypothetical protein